MPTIVREDHGDLNVTLTLNIPKEDYAPTYKDKLKEYRKTANIKGFRKGQVPLGQIRKMFGKGALSEIINELISKEVAEYLKQADFEILGQPLPLDQENISLNTKELQDYSFKFAIGLAPEFEVQGLDNNAFNRYDVSISEDRVNDELTKALKSIGERTLVEDEVIAEDVIKIEAVELSGPLPKENGLTPAFQVSFDELTPAMQELVATKKKGDTFRFDISNLSEGKDETFVKKHFLQLNPDAAEEAVYGNEFEGTITEVHRVIVPEANQEALDKLFGPNAVSGEGEAKAKIEGFIKQQYDNPADNLLFEEVVAKLREENKPNLPNEFLEKWIKSNGSLPKGADPKEEVEKMQESLQWNLVQNKLIKRFDIKVSEEEIKSTMRAQFSQHLGGQDVGNMMDGLVDQMMKNEEQVNQLFGQIQSSKMFFELKKVLTTNEIPISIEDFEALLKERQETQAAKEAAAVAEEIAAKEPVVATEAEESVA